jgi:hypothetical protein
MLRLRVCPEKAERLFTLLGRVVSLGYIVPFDSLDTFCMFRQKAEKDMNRGLFHYLMATWSMPQVRRNAQ